jgi:3-oxoacyl-(acyl-carrier-protein) synthase
MGFVTPHGDDADSIFQRVFAGESVIRRVRSGREGWAADVLVGKAEWNPQRDTTPIQRVAMDPVAQMAFVSAQKALTQAGLIENDTALDRAGIYMGCSIGGAETNEQGYQTYHTRSVRRAKPSIVPRVMSSAVAAHISMEFGIRGPSQTYSVACASSAMAIGEAFRAIRDGYLDCVVAGGAEAMLADAVLAAWEALGVLAREHPDGPEASVRPFDAARTGFALAEGAAVLILESEEHARARGVKPLGEIVGYGASSDAHNLTHPYMDGQARCLRAALADACLPPEAIGYISAHATGTLVGDRVEVYAIKEVFGAHALRVPVSATKSMHGHLVGAAGAVELGLTLMGLARGQVPPTANLSHPDAGCDLDCVPMRGREVPGLDYALSNSFAFGGSNVSLVARRV